MSVAPGPEEIYERAKEEGRRRLSMPMLEQMSTAFIAGVTIVFGITALGVVEALAEPRLGAELAALAGALAFGIGIVFLVVGRSELFSENFFDPVATAIDERGGGVWQSLGRLWGVTFVLNLVGGVVLIALLTIDGALPEGAPDALGHVAEDIASRTMLATAARAFFAGALVTLLSYMLSAVNSVTSRILVAYMVGVLLALGPFDHVIVSVLHLLFGILDSHAVSWSDLGENLVIATVGNVVGGLGLITLTHTAQVRGARE